MITINLSKPMGKSQEFTAPRSTVSYKVLAEELGFNPEIDNPMLTVAVDAGRANSVISTDEMTVVDGMHIEISW